MSSISIFIPLPFHHLSPKLYITSIHQCSSKKRKPCRLTHVDEKRPTRKRTGVALTLFSFSIVKTFFGFHVNHVLKNIIIPLENQHYSFALLNPPSLSQNLDFPRNFGAVIFFFDFLFTCFGQNISQFFNTIPHFPVTEVSNGQNLISDVSLTLK